MKRPAAAMGKMNATIEQLQNGGDLDGGRDKGKALKYQRMKESEALPNRVIHLIEVESKKRLRSATSLPTP